MVFIINILGSIVSIVSFILGFIVKPLLKKHKKQERFTSFLEKYTQTILIIVFSLLVTSNLITVYFLNIKNNKVENANKIIRSYPKSDNLNSEANGQLRGHIILGYNFIMKYQLMESIEIEKLENFLYKDLYIANKNESNDYYEERTLLKEAFHTVATIIMQESTEYYY